MTYYLAELYSPKTSWLELDAQGRQAFFEKVGAGMGGLAALGVEALALGPVDATKPYAPDQSFFAIWRFPDEAALDTLIAGITATGWHDYFDTINAAGAGTDLGGHLAQLAGVPFKEAA
ncbi:DUF6616 family protein [Brucella pseudogrignonensis]|uniref:Uncharacterized protein n=1 Tax=Brucella pseudogrignonensis TaxID=419475 RepID=A0ABU1M9B5_9HYPH|nr:DUF6616 family protein [Brucella pseudogrignonensis]MDR6432630.1 hypothetical protein [Brucella pseudogrignonensis]